MDFRTSFGLNQLSQNEIVPIRFTMQLYTPYWRRIAIFPGPSLTLRLLLAIHPTDYRGEGIPAFLVKLYTVSLYLFSV